jgi:fructosamine-3-kinase
MKATVSWRAICKQLQAINIAADPDSARPISGGCINRAWRLDATDQTLFVKTNAIHYQHMFEAEAAGLEEIQRAQALRVPLVIAHGAADETAWLALEWIERGQPDNSTEQALGELLATMHRYRAARHGWHRNNTIGSTTQINTECDDWVSFYAENRLRFQIDLAVSNGYARDLSNSGYRLIDAVADFFQTYTPVSSLLHGDLWAGNWSADVHGRPYVYDPAVYFGDREADIAMTRLFGGFGNRFYDAYHASWPMDDGWQSREPLYQLYHILNHLNLFGGGYLGQARALIDRCLSESGA